jgi:Fur family peroxide stress response transcriptional regulator
MADDSGSGSNEKLTERMVAFQARCRQKGLKITPQRMAVFKVLVESNEHPSAESVFRQVRKVFPNISLDTVNRTLLMLNEIGAAFVVEGSGSPKRFDANLHNHHHFLCVECRKIIDFTHGIPDDIDIPKTVTEMGYPEKIDRFRVLVLKKTVYLQGICEECLKKR